MALHTCTAIAGKALEKTRGFIRVVHLLQSNTFSNFIHFYIYYTFISLVHCFTAFHLILILHLLFNFSAPKTKKEMRFDRWFEPDQAIPVRQRFPQYVNLSKEDQEWWIGRLTSLKKKKNCTHVLRKVIQSSTAYLDLALGYSEVAVCSQSYEIWYEPLWVADQPAQCFVLHFTMG